MMVMQAVAPRQSYGSKNPHRQSMTRVAALVICCGMAALVALGGAMYSPEPENHAPLALSIRAQLQSQLQIEQQVRSAKVKFRLTACLVSRHISDLYRLHLFISDSSSSRSSHRPNSPHLPRPSWTRLLASCRSVSDYTSISRDYRSLAKCIPSLF